MAGWNWKPYAIGLAVTLLVIAGGWLGVRYGGRPSGTRDNAYAAHVAITGARVSSAQSMMAGSVVYYDGTLENLGDKTLSGYVVKLTFDDLYGRPIVSQQRVLLDDHVRPIPPHSQRKFEIGFDTVPGGWNQVPPDAKAVAVYVH